MWNTPGLCRECGRPTYAPLERAQLERVKALDVCGDVVLAALLDGEPLPPQAVRMLGWLVQGAREGVKVYELAGAIGYNWQTLASRFVRAKLFTPWFYLSRVRCVTAAYYVDRGATLETAANMAEFSSASDLGRWVRRERHAPAREWLRRPFRDIAHETRAELFPERHLTVWLNTPIIVERLTCNGF